MSIISEGKFKFYSNIVGEPDSLIIQGFDIDQEMLECKKRGLRSVALSFFETKGIYSLDFFERYNFIESVSISDLDVDIKGLYFLDSLKFLSITGAVSRNYIDFSTFKWLKDLSTDWSEINSDFSHNFNMQKLVLYNFKPKSKSLSSLSLPEKLENLVLVESNIINFEGLNSFNIKTLEGHYCKSLASVKGIKSVSGNLKALTLDYCRKLHDYDEIKYCKGLETLILGDCGDIPSIGWIKELRKITHFSFWNTRVIDMDISPCIGIKFVSFKDAKGYSHKSQEFDNQS